MSLANNLNEIRIGIDIGGTFTDFIIYRPDSDNVTSLKLLSTPENPAIAVLTGLEQILGKLNYEHQPIACDIIHGSTVATNALLERKGARTALITTMGFRDVLQIGRQNRASLYDLFHQALPPLVPAELRFEVRERVDQHGRVLEDINLEELDALIQQLKSRELEAVAVCLLFSFLHPEHEALIAERLRQPGLFVCLSSQILPEYREYERTSTTVVNAYVSPIIDKYLSHLEKALGERKITGSIKIMQSNGGCISLREARQNGVRCILSGPAGGLVGAHFVARNASKDQDARIKIITFDMGGTSTDVSLIEDEPSVTTESIIGGAPIRVPVLDIHTIGAGGGSIARVDAGGALRVGPESAGAEPGPACYGRGTLPTVTDANLLLGRLPAEYFLGGKMALSIERARIAIESLAEQLGLSPIETALGITEVVNANMERALRVISVERGYDPRDFTLLSFGGAGGLHCSSLAKRIGSPRVFIPPLASTLSAFGMIASDLLKDYTQTVMLPGDTPPNEIAAAIQPLVERGLCEIASEGIAHKDITITRLLDIRYRGQSYELSIPFSDDLHADFDKHHQKTYGYCRPEAPIEIVNLRVRARGAVTMPQLKPQNTGYAKKPIKLEGERHVYLSPAPTILPLYIGEALPPGSHLSGPALIARQDTTVLIETGDECQIDAYGNMRIDVRSGQHEL